MWNTGAACTMTMLEGQTIVFIAVDHATSECVRIHAASVGNRFEAPKPLRQGIKTCFGAYGRGVATGLASATTAADGSLPRASRTHCASWEPSPGHPPFAVRRAAATPSAEPVSPKSNCSGCAPSPLWRSSGGACRSRPSLQRALVDGASWILLVKSGLTRADAVAAGGLNTTNMVSHQSGAVHGTRCHKWTWPLTRQAPPLTRQAPGAMHQCTCAPLGVAE